MFLVFLGCSDWFILTICQPEFLEVIDLSSVGYLAYSLIDLAWVRFVSCLSVCYILKVDLDLRDFGQCLAGVEGLWYHLSCRLLKKLLFHSCSKVVNENIPSYLIFSYGFIWPDLTLHPEDHTTYVLHTDTSAALYSSSEVSTESSFKVLIPCVQLLFDSLSKVWDWANFHSCLSNVSGYSLKTWLV